jgi:hypothetical protein
VVDGITTSNHSTKIDTIDDTTNRII